MVIRINASYFCAGLVTNKDNVVIYAADILRWSIGKPLVDVLTWAKQKSMTVDIVDREQTNGVFVIRE